MVSHPLRKKPRKGWGTRSLSTFESKMLQLLGLRRRQEPAADRKSLTAPVGALDGSQMDGPLFRRRGREDRFLPAAGLWFGLGFGSFLGFLAAFVFIPHASKHATNRRWMAKIGRGLLPTLRLRRVCGVISGCCGSQVPKSRSGAPSVVAPTLAAEKSRKDGARSLGDMLRPRACYCSASAG